MKESCYSQKNSYGLEGMDGFLQRIEINELAVTMPKIVGCSNRPSSHGQNHNLEKLKECHEKIHKQETFMAYGVRCQHCSLLEWNKRGWFPLHC